MEQQVILEKQEDNILADITNPKDSKNYPFLSNVSKLTRGSHKRVGVFCQFGVISTCKRIVIQTYQAINGVMKNHDGKYCCASCSCSLRYTRTYCTYNTLNIEYFSSIDTEAKAYLLGWIASDGCVRPGGAVVISVHEDDEEIIRNLKDSICPELPIFRRSNATTNMVGFSFNSKKMVKDICCLLGITPGKKSDTVNFPRGFSDEITWAFIRGLFDGDGTLRKLRGKRSPHRHCAIGSTSDNMKEGLANFTRDLKSHIRYDAISFTGDNSLEFLKRMYGNASPNLRLGRKYDLYLEYLDYVPGLNGHYGKIPNCRYVKTRLDAISPWKESLSNKGYRIVLISIHKNISDTVISYDTGIKISPDSGWSVEFIVDDSFVESGYILTSNTFPSDGFYVETLKVSLTKVNPEAPALQLPFNGIQMTLREPR